MSTSVSANYRTLCHTIIDGFLLFIRVNVIHLKKNMGVTTESSKNEVLFACCILIKYLTNLPNDYFDWLHLSKTELFKMILEKSGENIEDNNNYFINPIIGDENNISNPIIVHNLNKVFLACTMMISNEHVKKSVEKEHHNILQLELKKKPLIYLSTATADGIDNISNNDNQNNISNIIKQKVNKISAQTTHKITNKVICNRDIKNKNKKQPFNSLFKEKEKTLQTTTKL